MNELKNVELNLPHEEYWTHVGHPRFHRPKDL